MDLNVYFSLQPLIFELQALTLTEESEACIALDYVAGIFYVMK